MKFLKKITNDDKSEENLTITLMVYMMSLFFFLSFVSFLV